MFFGDCCPGLVKFELLKFEKCLQNLPVPETASLWNCVLTLDQIILFTVLLYSTDYIKKFLWL